MRTFLATCVAAAVLSTAVVSVRLHLHVASLRYRLTETMAQLVSLHVSRAYRRHGVATRLVHELMRLARQSNARDLYVSAAPTASAIGFYTRHGFAPTAHVNQRLYDLEPEDIHMTLTL